MKKKTVTKKKVPRRATKPKPKAAKTVLVLRTCQADGTSYGGFKWPLETGSIVTAPDWDAKPECGHGLHGWLWGCGNWELKAQGENILWQVLEVDASRIVELSGKVKFPACKVLAVEKRWDLAMAFIRGNAQYRAEQSATGDYSHASATGNYGRASATGDYSHASATGNYGHASATGDYGHASATGDSGHASATGYSGHASATGNSGHASATGDYSHASATGNYGRASATGYYGRASATGDYSHASATGDYSRASATGYSGHASATGDYSHASATGYSGHASATGYSGHASATGYYGHASATGNSGHASATGNYGWAASNKGQAKAGENGVISILWNGGNRPRLAVGYVGEDGIEADTWYRVENGKLVKA